MAITSAASFFVRCILRTFLICPTVLFWDRGTQFSFRVFISNKNVSLQRESSLLHACCMLIPRPAVSSLFQPLIHYFTSSFSSLIWTPPHSNPFLLSSPKRCPFLMQITPSTLHSLDSSSLKAMWSRTIHLCHTALVPRGACTHKHTCNSLVWSSVGGGEVMTAGVSKAGQ